MTQETRPAVLTDGQGEFARATISLEAATDLFEAVRGEGNIGERALSFGRAVWATIRGEGSLGEKFADFTAAMNLFRSEWRVANEGDLTVKGASIQTAVAVSRSVQTVVVRKGGEIFIMKEVAEATKIIMQIAIGRLDVRTMPSLSEVAI